MPDFINILEKKMAKKKKKKEKLSIYLLSPLGNRRHP